MFTVTNTQLFDNMDNNAKSLKKLSALIEKRPSVFDQENHGRRRFPCDPQARSYPTFRNDDAADYYTDCAAAVPELAQLHGDYILALTSCVAQQQAEIAFLRDSIQQLQNSLITTQAAKDVLMEITKLVKSGKSVTNAEITLSSKGKIKQRKSSNKGVARNSENANSSLESTSVILEGILSCFAGGVSFDSSSAKASLSKLKEVVKEQVESANDSESQIEVKIGIGHLG